MIIISYDSGSCKAFIQVINNKMTLTALIILKNRIDFYIL